MFLKEWKVALGFPQIQITSFVSFGRWLTFHFLLNQKQAGCPTILDAHSFLSGYINNQQECGNHQQDINGNSNHVFPQSKERLATTTAQFSSVSFLLVATTSLSFCHLQSLFGFFEENGILPVGDKFQGHGYNLNGPCP